jgi:hypothetical protein
VISCDIIGFLYPRVRKLREKIEGVDHVIFTSTHCHSGADTVGLWGPFPGVSGLSPAYLKQLEDGVVDCVREAIERDFPGAVAVFLSGDLGGMQTPDVKEHTWAEIQRCGETIAARARESLAGASEVAVPELKFASASLEFPLRNPKFVGAFQMGVFGKDLLSTVREVRGEHVLTSEICALRLGEILFVTVPGEALPEVGKEVFALMNARHKFLVGLGQDEVGYILPKADFDPKKYEESMSLGPETAPTLLDALNHLLKGF